LDLLTRLVWWHGYHVSLLDTHVKFDIKLKIIVKDEGGNLLHPKISILGCEPFSHNKLKIEKMFNLF
jgi:hypothetical protein